MNADHSPPALPSAAAPPTAAVRHRLQQLFERAKQSLEKRDYVYAHDLLTQCVSGDPGSKVYLTHFRANLAQMHPGPAKRPSGFSALRSRKGTVAKPAGKGQWADAFTAGCNALKKSPHEPDVLSELADAAGQLGHTDCQLYYLHWALEIDPSDLDINRQAAAALEAIGEFEQAIGCWQRVLQHKPADEQSSKAISRLSVEKTIDDGGYNPALLKNDGAIDVLLPQRVANRAKSRDADGSAENIAASEATARPPAEQEASLRAAIDAAPADALPYQRLADFYVQHGRLQDAERLYRKALAAAGGGDLTLLEKLEDVYLLRMREQAIAARRRAERVATEAAAKLAEQAAAASNQAEAEVYGARASRSPADAAVQFEFALRLKRVGKHREAIEPLQAARADSRRLAEVQLHLGECFQHIGQHRLAMRSYEGAIAALPTGEWNELRKLTLYRAGVLAMGMGDVEGAERHLTDLASADFGYRDVSDRLDKLTRIRNAT
ncbi:MAG: hypothetical protein ACRCT8_07745 [Lacipirellulaceae bacterium]